MIFPSPQVVTAIPVETVYEQPRARTTWGPAMAALIALAWAVTPVLGFQRSLLILTLIAFAAVIGGLRFPAVGLLGIAMLCVLDAPSRVYLFTGGLLRWNTLNYWLLLMMALYFPFLARLRDAHSLALMAFAALLGIEVLISPDFTNGAQNVLSIIATFGMLIYFVRAGFDRRMWFWISFNAGLTGALGGMMFNMERINLPIINENAWAASPLSAIVAIVLGFPAAAELRRGQSILLALAATNLMWIFLSGSRGTLAIGALCFVSLMIGMRGMRQRTVALVGAVMLALVVLSHFSELQDRTIHRITKLVTTDHSMVGAYSLGSRTSGRSDLAIGGWYIFQEHPLGVGTGGFPTAWSQFGRHYGLTYGRGQEKAAHSGWLKTLVENGIPGIVLMVYFVFSFGVVGMRQRSWALWRLGMLTTVVLAAAFISSEFQTKGLWFLAAGAITFLQRDRVLAAMYGRDPAEDDRFGGLPRRSYAEVRER
jgi:hypothetical protein